MWRFNGFNFAFSITSLFCMPSLEYKLLAFIQTFIQTHWTYSPALKSVFFKIAINIVLKLQIFKGKKNEQFFHYLDSFLQTFDKFNLFTLI